MNIGERNKDKMTTLICPYTNNCILYRNFVGKTSDDRVNIIFETGKKYFCLVVTAHDDPVSEGGIMFNEEVSRRIKTANVEKNLNLGDVECSHITLLNRLV